eukprot:COSAG05_NODE_29_length_29038_cov_1237.466985_16_plen_61_part_00
MTQTFIYNINIMPKTKYHTAATKIQTLARSKRAKQTMATLRSERIHGRTAYKSYLQFDQQ